MFATKPKEIYQYIHSCECPSRVTSNSKLKNILIILTFSTNGGGFAVLRGAELIQIIPLVDHSEGQKIKIHKFNC